MSRRPGVLIAALTILNFGASTVWGDNGQVTSVVPPHRASSIAAVMPRVSPGISESRTLTDRDIRWPTRSQWRRVLLLEDYNTRVVVLSICLLGAAAGLIGSFTLLRKRALMGDALSHATLPGICLAFMFTTVSGGDGKSLPMLLLGATLSGLLGVGTILAIRNLTRLKEDAALGIVLSVFFGAGVALMTVVQQMESGHAAGLESFVYGKTASMTAGDANLIGAAAAVCIVASLLLFKELKLLCFDEGFAGSRGFPVLLLDLVVMTLVVLVTIVGLQAVGLILMIALLVIPAAAARFWTESMWLMALISSLLGCVGGMVGAGMSALFSRLPSGSVIVLVCTTFFFISLVFGSARGLLVRLVRRRSVNRSVDRQHLLRAIYEVLETRAGEEALRTTAGSSDAVSFDTLLSHRTWSPRRLARAIRRAKRDSFVRREDAAVRLTQTGIAEAKRLTRQHRLWELYLITHADVAAGHVDREADAIEHVLQPGVVAELESMLSEGEREVPRSPHAIDDSESGPVGTATGGR